jgi:two-component system chemotaxis response regulator CheY
MKLLVVDHSATRRRIVVNSLQRIGFTDVVEARGGREALERFDASVGLVITDRELPDPGVPGLARELRARPDGRMVPILMVTTRSAREDILAATDAGVSGHIVAPFTPAALRERIEQLCGAGSAR